MNYDHESYDKIYENAGYWCMGKTEEEAKKNFGRQGLPWNPRLLMCGPKLKEVMEHFDRLEAIRVAVEDYKRYLKGIARAILEDDTVMDDALLAYDKFMNEIKGK